MTLLNASWHCREVIIASGTCGANGDNLTWTLDDAGTLTISGEGEMADYSNDIPWHDHMSEIKNLVLTDGVTSIGDNAFSGCSSLSSITIPDGVTSIGYSAFYGCSALTNIKIPNGVTSIGGWSFGDSGLTSVTIPDSVTSIDEGAFSGTGLKSITIPAAVTNIGENAFGNCKSMTEIRVDENNTAFSSIDGNLYNKEQTVLIRVPAAKAGAEIIPEGVTSIGYEAFSFCEGLTSISLPESLTSIGDYAFWICSGLTNVTIPESVTEIGSNAFCGCIAMTSVTIPEGVTSIGYEAFSYCKVLADVYYAGTEAQKTALTDNGWSSEGNESFFNATWHCAVEPDGIVTIGSATGVPGWMVTVPVELTENPGISYLKLTLDYDAGKLELTEISTEGSCLGGGWTLNTAKGIAVWAAADDNSATGKLLTLRFRVKEDAAEGPVTVGLSGIKSNNIDDELLNFACDPGMVTVKHRIPGDLTGDGEVDGRDLTRLARHLAAYEVAMEEWNADVTGDGVVNLKDLTRLCRFLAEFDVVLE